MSTVESESGRRRRNMRKTRTKDQDSTSERHWQQVTGQIPETVEDFLRNFLLRLGLIRTLDHFQREWYRDRDHRVFVPDALTYQSLVQSELAQVRLETGLLRCRVLDLNQTLVGLQRERDFHRNQSVRADGHKGALQEDLRRLREHRQLLNSALSRLNQAHETALRTRTLTKGLNQV